MSKASELLYEIATLNKNGKTNEITQLLEKECFLIVNMKEGRLYMLSDFSVVLHYFDEEEDKYLAMLQEKMLHIPKNK